MVHLFEQYISMFNTTYKWRKIYFTSIKTTSLTSKSNQHTTFPLCNLLVLWSTYYTTKKNQMGTPKIGHKKKYQGFENNKVGIAKKRKRGSKLRDENEKDRDFTSTQMTISEFPSRIMWEMRNWETCWPRKLERWKWRSNWWCHRQNSHHFCWFKAAFCSSYIWSDDWFCFFWWFFGKIEDLLFVGVKCGAKEKQIVMMTNFVGLDGEESSPFGLHGWAIMAQTSK